MQPTTSTINKQRKYSDNEIMISDCDNTDGTRSRQIC